MPRLEGRGSLLSFGLDGTLLRTDSIWESVFLLARRRWYALGLIPVWLLRGGSPNAYCETRSRDGIVVCGKGVRISALAEKGIFCDSNGSSPIRRAS